MQILAKIMFSRTFPNLQYHVIITGMLLVIVQPVPSQHDRCVDETYAQTGRLLRLLFISDQGHVEGKFENLYCDRQTTQTVIASR